MNHEDEVHGTLMTIKYITGEEGAVHFIQLSRAALWMDSSRESVMVEHSFSCRCEINVPSTEYFSWFYSYEAQMFTNHLYIKVEITHLGLKMVTFFQLCCFPSSAPLEEN